MGIKLNVKRAKADSTIVMMLKYICVYSKVCFIKAVGQTEAVTMAIENILYNPVSLSFSLSLYSENNCVCVSVLNNIECVVYSHFRCILILS